jgi:hypothetical protein
MPKIDACLKRAVKAALALCLGFVLSAALYDVKPGEAAGKAAPATYLVELFDADKTSSEGKELTAMTVLSWSRLENLPVTTIVEPDAVRAFEKTARACIESLAQFEAINKDEQPLQTMQFLKADPSETEPWKGIMLHNTPGQAPARRCSSPKAPPIRRSGPRSPSNSAIISAAKARAWTSSSFRA